MTTGTEAPRTSPTAVAAQWRAMPPTRLLDCGMDYADVLSLGQLTATGVPWDVAAEQLAQTQSDRALHARKSGHLRTATEAYRSSAACLLIAQMAFNFDEPRKVALYRRFTDTVFAAAELSDPAWERLELPFEGRTLFGWLVRPQGAVRGTVVAFGGQSGWGAAYLKHADALARRGMATLLAEGPGQGETRMVGNLLLDVDIPAAYRVFVSYVLARPELGGAVGLWGNSLGGLFAALTAAEDPRVTAVCVNGAPAAPRLLPFRTFAEQAAAMLGTSDEAAVTANFTRLAFRSDERAIRCPLLVLHGEKDPVVSLEEQQPFLDAALHPQTELRVWPDGEHTIYNHADERTALVADWFADQLTHGKGATDGRR